MLKLVMRKQSAVLNIMNSESGTTRSSGENSRYQLIITELAIMSVRLFSTKAAYK
ncbi:hypothetical protein GCM10007966_01840 [Legionella impletisoli]|uniref:Uncharacterized protein n=1 Tax=Legionella impletisoli TaxID=343510 RepID=A0A917N871_9GAMM|nr:hypothetical protein GCM10007966_01840 [Legionella impletisoli]